MQSPPHHLELLSPKDKEVYSLIYQIIASPSNRNKRNKRYDDFANILEALKTFIIQDEDSSADEWKRSLVCGVCFLKDGIAVNTAQLKKLTNKCKSTINGSLKGMGYEVLNLNDEKSSQEKELLEKIPFLSNNLSDLRKWTVRKQFIQSSAINSDITPPSVDDSIVTNTNSIPISIGTNEKHNKPQNSVPKIEMPDYFCSAPAPDDFAFDFDSSFNPFLSFDSMDSESTSNLDIPDSFLSFE